MKLPKLIIGIAAIILFFVSIYILSAFYPEILWYDSFGYEHVWWQVVKLKALVFFSVFFGSFFFFYLNLSIAKRLSGSAAEDRKWESNASIQQLLKLFPGLRSYSFLLELPSKLNRLFVVLVSLFLSLLFGLSALPNWMEIMTHFNRESFGVADPIHGMDVGFYMFSLPFYNMLHQWAFLLLLVSIALSVWMYVSSSLIATVFRHEAKPTGAKKHLFILFSLVAALFSWRSWLGIYGLMYSTSGVAFGAGYTDVNVFMAGLKLMSFALGVFAILLVVFGFRKGIRQAVYGIFGLVIIGLALVIVPQLVQNFRVNPNEMEKEAPFIAHNIDFTRKAYGLDNIVEHDFPVTYNLTLEDIERNRSTVKNIRLWNLEPIKQTFRQLQEIRPYYEFSQVDVDRYMIDGELRQVMLSVREMDSSVLPEKAKSWVNQHLFYTHGYGVVMAPVDEKTTEGLPQFFINDIPPVSTAKELTVTQPAIYFGENQNNYVVVKTEHEEFDYPVMGESSYAKAVYNGTGGVELSSVFRKMLYAYSFSDINLLISPLITKESRLIYNRNIQFIPREIAPFLAYDSDPYMVIGEDGRLVWMMDAYVLSSHFPYSQPYKNSFNYIRNSVKITINAYDGKTDFYIADDNDPLIRVLAKALPGLFKPISEMPMDLKSHIRYPKGMFSVQSSIFSTYHMTNPKVFYNQEDVWNIPLEKSGESESLRQPYYMILKLPNEEKESFILMIPYTPSNKNNMVAWLGARCDQENYGQLQAYKFPKNRTIYGPSQIESRIDQNTEISQKLTLWDQSGSRVFRGNIMIIPIENSLIYVEPIYLQATQSKLPELKRIILGYDDQIEMGSTLDEVFKQSFLPAETSSRSQSDSKPSTQKLGQTTFNMEALKGVLNSLKNRVNGLTQDIKDIATQLESAIDAAIIYDQKQTKPSVDVAE